MFVISIVLISKEICNVINNMIATRQLATILAFVALWGIKIEQMVTVWEKGSGLQFLFILSSDFEIFLKFILLDR